MSPRQKSPRSRYQRPMRLQLHQTFNRYVDELLAHRGQAPVDESERGIVESAAGLEAAVANVLAARAAKATVSS